MRQLTVIKHLGNNRIVLSYDMDSKGVEVMTNGNKIQTTWVGVGRNLRLNDSEVIKTLIPLGFNDAKDVVKSLEFKRSRLSLEQISEQISKVRKNIENKVLLSENQNNLGDLLVVLHNKDLLTKDFLEKKLQALLEGLAESIHSYVSAKDYNNKVKISCEFKNVVCPYLSIIFKHNDKQAKIALVKMDAITDELSIYGIGRAGVTEVHKQHGILGAGYLSSLLMNGKGLNRLMNELNTLNKETYSEILHPVYNLYYEVTDLMHKNQDLMTEEKK